MFADIPLKGAFYRRQTAIVAVIGAVYVMIYNILPINNEMLAMAFFYNDICNNVCSVYVYAHKKEKNLTANQLSLLLHLNCLSVHMLL